MATAYWHEINNQLGHIIEEIGGPRVLTVQEDCDPVFEKFMTHSRKISTGFEVDVDFFDGCMTKSEFDADYDWKDTENLG